TQQVRGGGGFGHRGDSTGSTVDGEIVTAPARGTSGAGAVPPRCAGCHQVCSGPAGAAGYWRCAWSSSACIRPRSSAGTASGLSARVGHIGSPTITETGTWRVRLRLRPFVHSRCVPHSAIGTSGTPAAAAILGAPLLICLTVNDWLIVASGKT